MPDDGEHVPDDEPRPSRAIASGLIALVAVALSVGLVLGAVALGATSYFGVGDDGEASGGDRGEQSLYLPRPEKTSDTGGPDVTLSTEGSTDSTPTDEPTETESPEDEISLQVAQTEVGSFEPIDLTGVYTGGEGAILRVQRFEGGRWADFDVTIPVSNETFATYVQTAVTGVNRWRVVDTDTGTTSNEVKVTVG